MPYFFSSWFSKPKTKQYDYKRNILSRIKANTMYVKSSILFRETEYHWYGNYMIMFSTSCGDGGWGLHMSIKNDDVILSTSEEIEDCVVCTEEINTTIKCCKKPICIDCVQKIKQTSGTFACPNCRRHPNNNKCVVLRDPDFDYFFNDEITMDEKLKKVEEIIS